eukprot:CAMPEP_0117682732 /NCGR_PEP_ID=MMETSP0804-20121206/19879_1 /TAXON_ID=1074897 /ORGANISM="Tetraselmis astigmatica, Strain CCMP880" /LENGTH=142 /DNA_ID=CAMNT_0005492989 /DNA_START=405 /DNA_END=834 /DNA_ORIENTATION=-
MPPGRQQWTSAGTSPPGMIPGAAGGALTPGKGGQCGEGAKEAREKKQPVARRPNVEEGGEAAGQEATTEVGRQGPVRPEGVVAGLEGISQQGPAHRSGCDKKDPDQALAVHVGVEGMDGGAESGCHHRKDDAHGGVLIHHPA